MSTQNERYYVEKFCCSCGKYKSGVFYKVEQAGQFRHYQCADCDKKEAAPQQQTHAAIKPVIEGE